MIAGLKGIQLVFFWFEDTQQLWQASYKGDVRVVHRYHDSQTQISNILISSLHKFSDSLLSQAKCWYL